MIDLEPEITLKRILVALDASEPSRAVLESAARLAASLHSELVGLFVEDADLLQMSALPMTRLVSAQSGVAADLDLAKMERALKAQARFAREALIETARQWKVRYSFQVVRGTASERLLVEAQDCDLVALGTTSRPGRRSRPLGSTARETADLAPCSVFLSRAAPPSHGPVVAIAQGNEKTLNFAGKLAKIFGRPLAILAVGGDQEEARRVGASCQEWSRSRGVAAEITALAADEEKDPVSALRSKGAGLFVIDRRGPWTDRLNLESLLEQLDCPVLLLR